jgi:hypothetical protein
VNDGEMPPDDHPKTPPLTGEEKEIVRRWIQAGAPHELPAELPKRTFTTPAPPPAKTQSTARVTLDLRDRPAAEVFAEITKQTGLRIDYTAPPKEPRLSITLKNGTALEALEYLVLCGNLALSWEGESAKVKPVSTSGGK